MTKIIAEFCQNHNGDFDLLKKMIESAKSSGASHAKIQTIFADNLSYRPQFEEGLVVKGKVKSIKRPYASEYQRLKSLEISFERTKEFVEICTSMDIIPMTTCFSSEHLKTLKDVGFNSIKVASYDCSSFPMIRKIKDQFEEVVISTGASFDDEIEMTSEILKGRSFSFLHCVTKYPTPLADLNLARMNWLKQFTPSVGFSDHSLVSETGLQASFAALTLGAEIIERHYTHLHSSETKDGPVSINPSELKQIFEFCNLSLSDRKEFMNSSYTNWREMIGQETRQLSDEELLNRNYYRGRFASRRKESKNGENMIYNWEELSL